MLVVACTAIDPQISNRSIPKNTFDWNLPPGFTPPPVPDSNPITADKVRLGRHLFYDKRLSVNGRGSCASCHQQQLAFTDGQGHAIGATGELHARSSMSLINVAYNRNFTWASRKLQTLEQQIEVPLFNESPIELGLAGRETVLIAELKTHQFYPRLFRNAFPESIAPIGIDNIIKSLASFVRTIIAANSPFDRLLYLDDQKALSTSARRGMDLFFSERLNCGECHQGQNIAGGQFDQPMQQEPAEFHNTGLYNIAGRNHYPLTDPGLRNESGIANDDGKFRAPSLRNIAVTAPYMHDGSVTTLSAVIDHYAAGGRSIATGPNAGIGSANAGKSPLLKGFELTAVEKSDLLGFLHSLTDDSVIDEPRFSKPGDDG